jgi:hypothetical protein
MLTPRKRIFNIGLTGTGIPSFLQVALTGGDYNFDGHPGGISLEITGPPLPSTPYTYSFSPQGITIVAVDPVPGGLQSASLVQPTFGNSSVGIATTVQAAGQVSVLTSLSGTGGASAPCDTVSFFSSNTTDDATRLLYCTLDSSLHVYLAEPIGAAVTDFVCPGSTGTPVSLTASIQTIAPPTCLNDIKDANDQFHLIGTIGGEDLYLFVDLDANGNPYLSATTNLYNTGRLTAAQFGYDPVVGLTSNFVGTGNLQINLGLLSNNPVVYLGPGTAPLPVATIFDSVSCAASLYTTNGISTDLQVCPDFKGGLYVALASGSLGSSCTPIDAVTPQAIGTACPVDTVSNFSLAAQGPGLDSLYATVIQDSQNGSSLSLALAPICQANNFCYSSDVGNSGIADFILRNSSGGDGFSFQQVQGDDDILLKAYTVEVVKVKRGVDDIVTISAVVYGDCSTGFTRNGVRGIIQDCSAIGGSSLELVETANPDCNQNIDLFAVEPVADPAAACSSSSSTFLSPTSSLYSSTLPPPLSTSSSTATSSFGFKNLTSFISSTAAATTLSSLITAAPTETPTEPLDPSSTSTATPEPAIGSDFDYVGCVGSTSGFAGFTQKLDSGILTVELCEESCTGFKYFGLHERSNPLNLPLPTTTANNPQFLLLQPRS